MTKTTFTQFLQYLQDELAISRTSIEEALRQLGQDSHLLPIALWQRGVLSLNQLDLTYDWLATAYKRQTVIESARFDAIAYDH